MIKFRKASIHDIMLYYEWVNDSMARKNSFNSEKITLNEHRIWLKEKLNDPNCLMLVFYDDILGNIGQVRFQKNNIHTAVISISIDEKQRGKGYSNKIIKIAIDYYQNKFKEMKIEALIKKNNTFSIRSFENAGFKFSKSLKFQNFETFLFTKK